MNEDDDMHDVVPSNKVVPLDDTPIMDVVCGTIVKVLFDSQYYKAQIVDHGKYILTIDM